MQLSQAEETLTVICMVEASSHCVNKTRVTSRRAVRVEANLLGTSAVCAIFIYIANA